MLAGDLLRVARAVGDHAPAPTREVCRVQSATGGGEGPTKTGCRPCARNSGTGAVHEVRWDSGRQGFGSQVRTTTDTPQLAHFRTVVAVDKAPLCWF
jgi:hypothetical protein